MATALHRDLVMVGLHNGWPDYVAWLAQRNGEFVDAPDATAGSCMPPIDPAPGSYLLEK